MSSKGKKAAGDGDWPPLVRCIFEEDASRIPILIAQGENPNSSFAGRSLMALAAYHGLPEVLEALIAGGARVPRNALSVLGDQDITDWKIDPIDIEGDYARVARILLANGATPHVKAYNGEPLISTFPAKLYPKIHQVLSDALSVSADR